MDYAVDRQFHPFKKLRSRRDFMNDPGIRSQGGLSLSVWSFRKAQGMPSAGHTPVLIPSPRRKPGSRKVSKSTWIPAYETVSQPQKRHSSRTQ